MRLGVPRKMLEQGVENAVRGCFYGALDILRARGAELVDIELPHAPYAISTYYVVATAEASSNLARYDGVRYGFRAEGARDLREMYEKTRSQGFGPEVKRRIMLGTYVLSAGYYDAYYLKAQQVRTLVRRDYDSAFEKVDAVVMPTSPTPAFRIGEKIEDPLSAVSDRRLHRQREPGRASRAERAVRADAEPSADRTAADRQAVRRSDAAEDWRQLRAGYELVESSVRRCGDSIQLAFRARSRSSGVFSTSIGPRGRPEHVADERFLPDSLLQALDDHRLVPERRTQLRESEDDAEAEKQRQDEHRARAEGRSEDRAQIPDERPAFLRHQMPVSGL